MMEQLPQTDELIQQQHRAYCPNCDEATTFRYHGKQQWPEAVARAAHLPTTITVWLCSQCNTTMLAPSLNFED